jgi:hypothetical protein
MYKNNLISITLGLAIMVGVVTGYIFSTKEYFFLHPLKGKKEVTQDFYESMGSSDMLKATRAFNLEAGLISGTLTVALSLLFIGLKAQGVKKSSLLNNSVGYVTDEEADRFLMGSRDKDKL